MATKKLKEISQEIILNSLDNDFVTICDWFSVMNEEYNIEPNQIIVQKVHEWMVHNDLKDYESSIHDYEWEDPYQNTTSELLVKFKYNG